MIRFARATNNLTKLAVSLLSSLIECGRSIHVTELAVIPGIVELSPELQVTGFTPELDLFHHGNVPVVDSGAANRQDWSIAVVPLRRASKSLGVKKAVEGPLATRQVWLPDEHRPPSISTPCDVGPIRCKCIERRWQPTGKSRDPGKLPVAKHRTNKGVVVAQLRQVPDIVEH